MCKSSKTYSWKCFALREQQLTILWWIPLALDREDFFLVLEEGELEGTDSYLAEGDADGAEGFLDALKDFF